jgi:leucyl aminopeptidase
MLPADSTKLTSPVPVTTSTDSREREPLQISIQNSPLAAQRADVIVVGVFADGTLSRAAQAIDALSNGRLGALVKRGDLEPKTGASLLLYDLPHITTQRVLLVSLGAREKFGDKSFREALRGAARVLSGGHSETAVVTLADIDVPGCSLEWRVQTASCVLADGCYQFDAPRAKPNGKQRGVRSVALLISGEVTPQLTAAMRRGHAIAEGMALAKDLGNLPGNICNPLYLAETARELGAELNFDVEVLEREDMAKLGMGSALSVGRASDQPCKFIVMHYQGGARDAKPVVLVGKGVTFDTGGISLKPSAEMDEMKFDMCGAASVLGTLRAVAELKLKLNVIGLVPTCENMPGGAATKPGDIVTSMSGQTIEILNTDAEGRLILADALSYAERFEPQAVVDIATLTGAIIIALGHVCSGLFANKDALAQELQTAGAESWDRVWQLPLWDDYQEPLKSNFADFANIGGRPAGSVTAACFLSKFTRKYAWAHLDIAGTAWKSGKEKGATGRPVPLLTTFLMKRAR